jgi:hypothetical protein
MWIPFKLARSISSNFDGLNVATWIPLKVILPKQATPWYQFVGSGGVDLSSARKNHRF